MILFLISFIAGILTILAPCVLPLLPVIVGGSIGEGKSLKKAITVTVSLAVSVILFTLLIKASTLLIGIPAEFWKGFSGGIIIAFGLIMLFPGLWEKLPFLSKLSIGGNKILASGYKKKNIWGDVIVGASLGPVFSTCSPTYFLVLAAVLPESFTLGILYLLAYSVGLSLALLAVAFVGQKIVNKVGVVADPHGTFKKVLGIIFILVGIAIITGFDKTLQIKILDAGFFDVTKIEQKLLELVPSNKSQDDKINMEENEVKGTAFLSLKEKKKTLVLAPQISTPDGFINTGGRPITLRELQGKVVLLDIWTYSCINCQRTLPYVNQWYSSYKDQGLEIVGLHTPEFAFEKVQANVQKAVNNFNIKYPVVLDNDYSTWNAYGNRFWPRKYLIDIDGYIVYDHIGEGGYKETEQAIQKALAERAARMGMEDTISETISTPVNAILVDSSRVKSPEVYFGSARNQYLANGKSQVSGQQTFLLPSDVAPNSLYLAGNWNITSEYAENQNSASIVFNYEAKNVYMAAGSDAGTEIEIYQDDFLVKKVMIGDEKLYTLINGSDYGKHVLRISIPSGSLKVFTFTFG